MPITGEESRELVRRAMMVVRKAGSPTGDSVVYRDGQIQITLRPTQGLLSVVVFRPVHRRVFIIQTPGSSGTRTLSELDRDKPDAERVLKILRELMLLDDLASL